MKAVPAPIESIPVTETAPPGVNVAVPDVERYPDTLIAALVVFIPLPLTIKLPYVFVLTDCAPEA